MTTIRIENVSRVFGATRAVDDVSLTIQAGELFFLLGPSGCGKTTLLRMIAGFGDPDAGRILLDEKPMNGVPPRLRETGMVFQSYALWPHRTVAGNVAYGLEVRGLSRDAIRERVAEALKMVRLEGYGERRVTQLSGGQQQRVALARALVIRPKVLLLDEPLSNLDARLRVEMREEIRRIHAETKLTMVYVTHDQKEALSLADRLAVLRQGRLAQVGGPVEVYNRPASRFVADFLGDSNFLDGTVREAGPDGRCTVVTPLGALPAVAVGPVEAGRTVVCSIRPEAFALGPPREGAFAFQATVERLAFLGEVQQAEVTAAGARLQVLGLQGAWLGRKPGDRVTLAVPAEQVVVLGE